jgi:hypothetical protein
VTCPDGLLCNLKSIHNAVRVHQELFLHARPALSSLRGENGIQVLATALGNRVCSEQLPVIEMCCAHLRSQRFLWQPGLLRDCLQHELLVRVGLDAGIERINRLIQARFITGERNHAAAKGVGHEQEDQFFHSLAYMKVGQVWEELKIEGASARQAPFSKLEMRPESMPIPSRVYRHITRRGSNTLDNPDVEQRWRIAGRAGRGIRYSSGASERRAFS